MKFLFILLMALSTVVAKSASKEDPITPLVRESFSNSFHTAQEVAWTESRYFFKADFLFNGRYVSAYFTKNGHLIATARNMVFGELPLFLQMSFKDNYKGYWISDLFEMTRDGETTYYLTVENGDQKVVMQSAANCWKDYDRKNKF